MNENAATTIDSVMAKALSDLESFGLSHASVWGSNYCRFDRIRKFYQSQGVSEYSPEVTAAFMCTVETRCVSGEVGRKYYMDALKSVERLDEVYLKGKLEWAFRPRLSIFQMNDQHEDILTDYLENYLPSRVSQHKTFADYTWVTKKYLAFLQMEGRQHISEVTVDVLSKFIFHCSQHLAPRSMQRVMCCVRVFHDYLLENDLLDIPYKGILSFSVAPRKMRVQPPCTGEELELILAQIDVSTDMGKRDYAIILLGAITGLRAIDIVHLKLRDIDWRRDKMYVCEQKKDEFLALPLIDEIGEALKEYILDARPESDSEYVFLRERAPFQRFSNGVAIEEVFASYQRKAGFERKPHDGKGFHSLRRMVGRDMSVAGVSALTIAQVLGHKKMDSTKYYISLDSKHLKECALDFRGIEIEVCHYE